MQRLRISFAFAPYVRIGGACLAAALLLPVSAAAQSLGNIGSAFRPQTPPPGAVTPSGNSGTADRPGAAASAAGGAPAGAEGASGLRLVLIGGSRNLASIDGRIVHVGDTVNGMRVMQIGPQGVILRGEGGAREQLTLNPAAVKKPANSTRVSTGARP